MTRQRRNSAFVTALAVVGALLIAASGARADIIFTPGNHPQQDETNILFGAPETGYIINGEVDHSGVGVGSKGFRAIR